MRYVIKKKFGTKQKNGIVLELSVKNYLELAQNVSKLLKTLKIVIVISANNFKLYNK